jgi:putative drug exporter of the RND superfamily
MSSIARWCFRRRFTVLGLWLAALIVLGGLSQAAGDQYTDQFTLSGTESARALELLQSSFKAQSGDSDQIVWAVRSGSVGAPQVKERVGAMLAKVKRIPHVTGISNATTSPAGKVAYATVNFDALPQDIPKSSYTQLIDTAEAARGPGLQVELGGNGIQQQRQPGTGASEFIGFGLAAIVLFIAFGSLFATILPLLSAVFALGVGLSVAGLIAGVVNIATFAPELASLIGLGVGIDYALFIVTRHRSSMMAGHTPEEAVQIALNTSGRAVLFAGGTVCVALLGLFVLGVSFLNGAAIASVVAVLATMLTAITLLPAFLGMFGTKVLSRKERRRLAAEGPYDTHAAGFWYRWSGFVQRRPAGLAIAAVVVMLVAAIPFFSLRLGSADAGSDPVSTTTRHAYDLLAQGFGAGSNGPLQLVAETPRGKGDQPALARLSAAVKAAPDVVAVAPPVFSPNGKVAILNVIPRTAPQDKATSDLITTLRDDVIPKAAGGTKVYVGGVTAIFDDFAGVLTAKLPQFIGVIVLLGCLLLLVAFRSVIVPLTAAAMNLLAAGAAFGVVTAVFQWGWGQGIIPIGRAGPVEAFLPVLMLAILFGLSMDYQVFLVSRMHEEWGHTHDNARAVRVGQADTGRVITAAAAIMILIFSSFTLMGERIISEFGVGLASAVLLDAFILRTVLVPALMHRIGPANWWLPKGLDRALPHVSIDPSEEEVTAPA